MRAKEKVNEFITDTLEVLGTPIEKNTAIKFKKP